MLCQPVCLYLVVNTVNGRILKIHVAHASDRSRKTGSQKLRQLAPRPARLFKVKDAYDPSSIANLCTDIRLHTFSILFSYKAFQ